MAGEDCRRPRRVSTAEAAFRTDPENARGTPRKVDAVTIPRIIVELQQTKIQAGSRRTSPVCEWFVKSLVGPPRHRNVNKFDWPPNEVGDTFHQLGKCAGISEAQQRLVARRAVA